MISILFDSRPTFLADSAKERFAERVDGLDMSLHCIFSFEWFVADGTFDGLRSGVSENVLIEF